MSRRKNRHYSNPDVTRLGQRGSIPAGARTVPLGTAQQQQQALMLSQGHGQGSVGQQSNSLGDNSLPISAYATPTIQAGSQATGQAGSQTTKPAQAGYQSNPFPPGDPVRPAAGLGPRQFQYPIGANITLTPRGTESTGFDTLRNLAALYDGIGLCERAHFRILERLAIRVQPRTQLLDTDEDLSADKWTTPARQIEEWFGEGPAKDGRDLTDWLIAAMKDLLEIDALGVYHRRTRSGGLYALELISGDTLIPLLDVSGRRPRPPAPAVRQVLYGAPGALFVSSGVPQVDYLDFTADQLDYWVIEPQTNSVYGQSPVEDILLDVNLALRMQNFNLTRYTDGATPEGVLETSQPQLFDMSIDKAREWEKAWNDVLSGNDTLRVRTKLVPPGFTFKPTKGEPPSTALDEWLLNKTIAAFGLTKDELGFTDTSNRSVGQSQEAVIYRQAVSPRTNYFARKFNQLNRQYDGMPLSPTHATISRAGAPTKSSKGTWDSRFVITWSGIEEPEDFAAKASVYMQLVDRGWLGRTAAKRLIGIPVLKGEQEVPAFITAQGGMDSVILIDDLIESHPKILESQQAQLETKIAGAKAAKQQFEAGGNPVQAAGMGAAVGKMGIGGPPAGASGGNTGGNNTLSGLAAGHVNAGAKQQIAAGQQSGGQQASGGNSKGGGANNAGGTAAQPGRGARPAGTGARTRRADGLVYDDGDGVWDAPVALGGDADEGSDLAAPGDFGARLPGPLRGGGAAATERALADNGDAAANGRLGLAQGGHEGRRTSDGPQGNPRAAEDAASSGANRVFAADRGDERRAAQVEASSEDQSSSKGDSEQEVSDEWARWRERALKDAGRGKPIRPFVSDVLPTEMHAWVSARLADCTTRDEVRAVFAAARAREAQRGADNTVDTKPEVGKDNGIMLAFFLPADVAREVAVTGGESPEDMHITLAILGTVDEFTPKQLGDLRRFAGGFASEAMPLHATFDGVHRFPANPQSGKYAVYAGVDAPGIQRWRQTLVKRLMAAGFAVDTRFPQYVPHVTLEYVLDGKQPTVEGVPARSFALRTLTLAVAGQRFDFPVGDEQYPDEQYPMVASQHGQVAQRLEEVTASMVLMEMRDMRTRLLAELGLS